MKFRRLTPAIALAAMCVSGVALAQTMSPTTPSTSPTDSTATPPNNSRVPPGTANPATNTGATPQSNTHKGTTMHKSGSNHMSNGNMSRSHSQSSSTTRNPPDGRTSSEPSVSQPSSGAGK
jgi:hypothetical protein